MGVVTVRPENSMDQSLVKISKFLSKVLRHEPGMIGLILDAQGWTDIDELLTKAAGHRQRISRDLLNRIVSENEKQRFAISPDGLRIRANQGHSVSVDLALESQQPPELLYHGTPTQFVNSIRKQGLIKGKRHHVHLSPDTDTAKKVGERRGKAVILTVHAYAMFQAGFEFYCSENGVWLTDHVPPQFIDFDR